VGAASLQRLRIKAKRVRYAAELAQPVMGKPAQVTARRAKAAQAVLGDVHDASMTASWLRQASQKSWSPEVAFLGGQVACQAEGAATDLRHKWRQSFKKLSAKNVARAWR
jgi:CHAD domain-containing protein